MKRSSRRAHQEKVAENWERIRKAGREGRRPNRAQEDADPKRDRDTPPPPGALPQDHRRSDRATPSREHPQCAQPGRDQARPSSQHAQQRVLLEILRTLQRIERKMDGEEEEKEEHREHHHGNRHHDDDDDDDDDVPRRGKRQG